MDRVLQWSTYHGPRTMDRVLQWSTYHWPRTTMVHVPWTVYYNGPRTMDRVLQWSTYHGPCTTMVHVPWTAYYNGPRTTMVHVPLTTLMKVCPQWRLSWMIDILSAELQMVLQLMRRRESSEVSPGVSSGWKVMKDLVADCRPGDGVARTRGVGVLKCRQYLDSGSPLPRSCRLLAELVFLCNTYMRWTPM